MAEFVISIADEEVAYLREYLLFANQGAEIFETCTDEGIINALFEPELQERIAYIRKL